MILATYPTYDPQKIQFHQGFYQFEIEKINTLLNPTESYTDTTEQIFINSETIKHIQQSLNISHGEWKITDGLLSRTTNPEIVITETLSNQDWLLLLKEVSIEKNKGNIVTLKILNGTFLPKGITATECIYIDDNVVRTPQTYNVPDINYILSGIKSDPLIIPVSKDLNLGDLLGHPDINRDTKKGKDPIIESDFYQALQRGRNVIFTNLDRNPKLEKELETLWTTRPYLYYLGNIHYFTRSSNIIPFNQRSTGTKSQNLSKKLDLILEQETQLHWNNKENFKAHFLELTNKVLGPLVQRQYSYVLDYNYLKKIFKQIQVEVEWDKSTTVNHYHVLKAFSSVLKEFKLKPFYKDLKIAIWEEWTPKQPLAGASKNQLENLRAIIMDRIQDKGLPSIEGGYGILIEQYIRGDKFPLEKRCKKILTGRHKEKNAIKAKQRLKDKRLYLKMKIHKAALILGPTGSGKTASGLRINKLIGETGTENPLFRATMGPTTSPEDLRGTLAEDPTNPKHIHFIENTLGKWAHCQKGEPILLLDEVTMIENWELFESYFEHEYFIINGKKVTPNPTAMIYMTGNESLNGNYSGRHLSDILRRHAIISKKPGMSKEEILEHIITPVCGKLRKPIRKKITGKLLEIIDLAQELRIHDDHFSTREIKDLTTQIVQRIGNDNSKLNERLFRLSREILIPLVNKEQTHNLDDKLRGITEFSGEYKFVIQRQVKERALLLNNPSGLKPGLIINGVGEDSLGLVGLKSLNIEQFNFQTGGQWANLMKKVKQKYDLGQKLMVQNAHLIPTEFWESLINQFMTEPKPGFMLILVNTATQSEKWIAPSLRSRFAMINKNSQESVAIPPSSLDIPKRSNSKKPIKVKSPPNQKKTYQPHFLDSDTKMPQNKPTPPQVYPKFDPKYTRQDILTINYDETNKPGQLLPMIRKQTTKNKIPYTPPISKKNPNAQDWSNPITLDFDKGGFAKIPSMSCNQTFEGYTTENNVPLNFYQDENGEFYVKMSCKWKTKPSALQVLATIPTSPPPDNRNYKSPISASFRAALSKFFLSKEGTDLSNKIAIQKTDSRNKKIVSLDLFFQSWTHGDIHFEEGSSNQDKIFKFLKTKVGVCRHRAYIAKVLCDYYHIPCRLEESTTHAWVSVLDDTNNWKRLEVHQVWNSSSAQENNSRIPKPRIVPSTITLPPPIKDELTTLDVLLGITINGTPLKELLTRKHKGSRSTTSGALDIHKLSSGEISPFTQDYIKTKVKRILTANKIEGTVECLFWMAGIKCTSIEGIIGTRISDEDLKKIEINGIDHYLYFSDNDVKKIIEDNLLTIIEKIWPGPKKAIPPKLFTKKLFSQLTNLDSIDLAHIDLSQVTNDEWAEFCKNNPNLKELNLSHCTLTTIPTQLSSLTKLTELNLEYNKIQTIPHQLNRDGLNIQYHTYHLLSSHLPASDEDQEYSERIESIHRP